MPTFGQRVNDIPRDSKGDILSDTRLTLYASEADAQAKANALGTVKTDKEGRWSFTHTDSVVWVSVQDGETYPLLAPASFVGPAVSVEVGASEAAIRAAATKLSASGGGTIVLPGKRITLTSPLSLLPGVKYVGQEPEIVYANTADGSWIPDSGWDFGAGGTVLVGDGTFACFEANSTDLGSVPAQVGTTAIENAAIVGLGIKNFTYGIRVGATNNMGLTFSKISRVWVRNCSQWGVRMDNFQHTRIEDVWTAECTHGQYYGANLPGSTLLPGNSDMGALFHVGKYTGNRFSRGIVFEARGTNETLNELTVSRVQSNCFGRSRFSDTATLTSGSTSVTVPDGTQYAVGMPVKATATLGGFTNNYVYMVKSVSGNTLTLGPDRSSAAISASASGSLTIQSSGFPNVEIVGEGTARVAHMNLQQLDVEGADSIGLYAEGFVNSILWLHDSPVTPLLSVVGRNTAYSEFHSVSTPTTDFDGASTTAAWFGGRGTSYQYALRGQWMDQANAANVLAIGPGIAGAFGGDIHTRANGFMYPANGMGERIWQRDTSVTLSGRDMGVTTFKGAAGQTFTLPTIVNDSSLGSSHIGAWYEIANTGTNALTVVTNGTQLFNGVAGKTSITVAAGSAVKITAAKDAGGILFWYARAVTLA